MDQINKYAWLAATIYNAKNGITFDEINLKWQEDTDISEGKKLPKSTFHRWRVDIETLFDVKIACDPKNDYAFYVENRESLAEGSFANWLFNNVSMSNFLLAYRQFKDRISLPEIPMGQDLLPIILDAMKQGILIQLTYKKFKSLEPYTHDFEPYGIKLFKQRWYVIGRNPGDGRILLYPLDRIRQLALLPDKHFDMPDTFSLADHFEHCYGVFGGGSAIPETVRLKVATKTVDYLRTLPLHPSQKEIKTEPDYSIFELRLQPAHDFQIEILSHTPDIEVLSPKSLRKEIAEKIRKMNKIYGK